MYRLTTCRLDSNGDERMNTMLNIVFDSGSALGGNVLGVDPCSSLISGAV